MGFCHLHLKAPKSGCGAEGCPQTSVTGTGNQKSSGKHCGLEDGQFLTCRSLFECSPWGPNLAPWLQFPHSPARTRAKPSPHSELRSTAPRGETWGPAFSKSGSSCCPHSWGGGSLWCPRCAGASTVSDLLSSSSSSDEG